MPDPHGRHATDRRIFNQNPKKMPSTSFPPANPRAAAEKDNATAPWRALLAFTTRTDVLPLLGAICFAVAGGIMPSVMSIFLGKIFDSFTDFGSGHLDAIKFREEVTQDSIYLALLGLATWIFDACFFALWMLYGELQARTCRVLILDGLLSKTNEWYDSRSSGINALMPRIQTSIRELQLATSQPLGSILQSSVTTISSLIMAFYYCWNLTLVILATLPLSALVLSIISSRMQPSITTQQKEMSGATKNAIAAFSTMETIKCSNGQEFEMKKYGDAIRRAAIYYLKQAKANAMQIGFARFMTMTMFVQGFWYGSSLVITGKRSTGNVVTTFYCALTALSTVEHILPQLLVLEKGRAAVTALISLKTLFDEKGQSSVQPGHAMAGKSAGMIEFHEVNFSYPTRPKSLALRNVTSYFPTGSTTFIVGKSGSGKSTMSQLLLRFYEPNSGSILINGKPLVDIDPHLIRKNITLVDQETTLFNGTLLENLLLGVDSDNDVSTDDIARATDFALLQDTIGDLQDGLNTAIVGKESKLSGGQRQRVALARARLRDSPVVIFDESTSALDQVTRSMILSAIRYWRKNRTTIFISHDISQIEDEDFVYVMNEGQIVEKGHRKDLEASRNSLFSSFLSDLPNSLDQEDLGSSSKTTDSRKQGYEAVLTHPGSDNPEMSRPSQPQDPEGTFDGLETNEAYSSKLEDIFKYPLSQKRGSRLSYIPSIYGSESPNTVGLFGSPILGAPLTVTPIPIWTTLEVPKRSGTIGARPRKAQVPVSAIGTARWSRRFSLETKAVLESSGLAAVDRRSTRGARVQRPPTAPPVDSVELNEISEPPPQGRTNSVWSINAILNTVWANLNRMSRYRLVIGFSSAAAHAVIIPLFSWAFSKLLATFYQKENASRTATKWSLVILSFAAIDAALSYMMHLHLETSGQYWVDKIRALAMRNILFQPLDFFGEGQNDPGQLAQILDRNAEEMRNLLGRFVAFMFVAFVLVLSSSIWSLSVCWKLTLIGLSMAPVSFAITRCFQAVSSRFESRSNDCAEAAGVILGEACTNIKTVRALTLETHFQDKHTKAAQKCFRVGIQRAVYAGFFYGMSQSTIDFFNALLFYAGAVLAASGNYSVQDILTVFSMLLFSMSNVTSIMAFIPQINSSKAAAAGLLHLSHELPKSSHEDAGTVRITNIGDITLHNLSFTYPSCPASEILHNISLTFPKYTITAIIGGSGSGKSTIASLLLRLYPTDNILISGRSISRIHTPTLRALVALVPQKCTIFPATIAQNIAYGKPSWHPHASERRVREAAEAAGIHAFIASLPSGYDTLIGEGGTTLSGGQAQRVGIARALVRRPRVLVLDEATSALDVESARGVREMLKGLVGVTVVMITHDLEMAEVADRVVVMEKGRVVSQGTREEVLKRGGGFGNGWQVR